MEKIIENLKILGISENLSKVYIYLCKRGNSTVNEIYKNIGLDRSQTYQILENLINKGLVNYIVKNKTKYFDAVNPEILISIIKEKEVIANNIIKQLLTLTKTKENKQEIRILEGDKGLVTFFKEVTSCKEKKAYSFGGTGKTFDILDYKIKHIIEDSIKDGFEGKMILCKDNKLNKKLFKIPNIEVRIIDNINSTVATTVYDDKFSIRIFGEKPLIIIIKNKDLAISQKSYFKYIWNKTNKVDNIKELETY